MVPVRLAELVGRLSLAFDIANNSLHGKAVRSVVLSVELGEKAGASKEELHDTFWVALLTNLGCTGFAHEETVLGAGDDRSIRGAMASADVDDPVGSVRAAIRGVSSRASLTLRLQALWRLFGDPTVMQRYAHAMCDTSVRLAEILGAGPRILTALTEICERWDGRGRPERLKGEALVLPIRLQHMGHVLEIAHQRGRAAAVAENRRRAGRHFDPRLAEVFEREQEALFAALEDPDIFQRFLRLEHEPVAWADEGRMDDLARVLGIFVDLKCPIFLGHSGGVAELAVRAAGHLGLGEEDRRLLRRAALLHDIGRLSVANGILARQGPLDWAEWEQVRLHSYYTERVLAASPALSAVAEIAVNAHERVDGSGYFQRRTGKALPLLARILAVADVAFAMSEERPHRSAHSPATIGRVLHEDARCGRLDPNAVEAVLAALGVAGNAPPTSSSQRLSQRELQVARLLARGQTNVQIGRQLGISSRTVQVHIAHIYQKLGVRSRAGATIWLVENGMIP